MSDSKLYQYPVTDCDVVDMSKLESYRKKRELWIELLNEDEEHSIVSQINRMIWNDAVFRMINQARKLAAKRSDGDTRINGTISEFIDQSYVATQLLAVRRLSESSKRGDEVSLKRLVRDIKDNLNLFTREIYVSHDGLPFDPEIPKREFLENLPPARLGSAIGGLPTSGPDAWGTSDRAHISFDKLCLGSPDRLDRDQVIDPKIFDKLINSLGTCSRFESIASKFIAHAADHSSREELPKKQRSVTLAQITSCHQAICRVAAFIYGPILFIGGFGLIPHAQFGHLEYLDEPWVTASELKKLESFWYAYHDSIESWTDGDWVEKLGWSR